MNKNSIELKKFLKEIEKERTSHSSIIHCTPEKWCKIKSYPDYLISSWGRVISLKYKSPRLMNGSKTNYHRIILCNNDTKNHVYVHRLVGIYFVKGRTKLKCEINHLDGNPLNNYYKNVEWCTPKYNSNHKQNILIEK